MEPHRAGACCACCACFADEAGGYPYSQALAARLLAAHVVRALMVLAVVAYALLLLLLLQLQADVGGVEVAPEAEAVCGQWRPALQRVTGSWTSLPGLAGARGIGWGAGRAASFAAHSQ